MRETIELDLTPAAQTTLPASIREPSLRSTPASSTGATRASVLTSICSAAKRPAAMRRSCWSMWGSTSSPACSKWTHASWARE